MKRRSVYDSVRLFLWRTYYKFKTNKAYRLQAIIYIACLGAFIWIHAPYFYIMNRLEKSKLATKACVYRISSRRFSRYGANYPYLFYRFEYEGKIYNGSWNGNKERVSVIGDSIPINFDPADPDINAIDPGFYN